MNNLFTLLRPCLVSMALLTFICCGLYPGTVWALAQCLFPHQARGSLMVSKDGTVEGSELLGQAFQSERCFQPRPSAAGDSYDAISSGGSNLGPTSRKLYESISNRVAAYRLENRLNPNETVPADAVTASASGLDPHISLRNAQLQRDRVARVRGLPEDVVDALIHENIETGLSWRLAPPLVHVLKLNRALDEKQAQVGNTPLNSTQAP